MFGSIGGPELILVFVLALLLFGPRKLPEIGKTIGKTLAEFKRATNDFHASLEHEIELEKLRELKAGLNSPVVVSDLTGGKAPQGVVPDGVIAQQKGTEPPKPDERSPENAVRLPFTPDAG